MQPLLLTLPHWRLTPTLDGLRGLSPAGAPAFCATDLGQILETLGPPTPVTEHHPHVIPTTTLHAPV
ncbi:MAG: hypothetical protein C7B45_07925 [Sulfobacillus acidophilus]|uniref:Uncharacterized protein n=1 Tax=Sulfobacillus acidophilus TaxID=53633 RepID=A0A2T2WIS6_9FIRM|nr:MAG: hypothetical protein C7B45_07925 [Sulfobacillus acidophilus]